MEFGTDTRNLTWETAEVSDDQVTAEISYTKTGGGATTETLTGTQEDITSQLSTYPKTAFDIMRSLQIVLASHSLAQGTTWTSDSGDVTTEFEVIGTDTVNGVSCTVVRAQDQGAKKYWELCVNENHPFLLSAVQFDQNGDVVLRIEMTDTP